MKYYMRGGHAKKKLQGPRERLKLVAIFSAAQHMQ